MLRLLRLLRGAIGMGLTWALAWFGAGVILTLIAGPGVDDVPLPIRFAILGFLSGVTFSGVLPLVAWGRRLDQLSLVRFAGWGAVGGLLLSGILAATAGPGSCWSLSSRWRVPGPPLVRWRWPEGPRGRYCSTPKHPASYPEARPRERA